VPVTRGILDAALIHPREVFRPAILENAAAVLLVHNHPSGDPTPSPEDRAVSRQMAEAGRSVGIRVLDHVVVGEGRWASALG
jgi:DNA repair protein RadC